MRTETLATPAFLLDLDILENNIRKTAEAAKRHGKLLCPMTKTHKSTEIARMQADAGVDGFVVGTVEEAEALHTFAKLIMLPYPILNTTNLARLSRLMPHCTLCLSLDSMEAALVYQRFFEEQKQNIRYLLLIDTGLHRLGVAPEEAAALVKQISAQCKNLHFAGISTHPGHVYACTSYEGVKKVAAEENITFLRVMDALSSAGFACEIAATGSTPTFMEELALPGFTMLRPGNYVVNDLEQVELGVARESDCALTVLATIIAHPAADRFIMDCGSKCLALDRGAHGNPAFSGYGKVLGHPELVVEGLSEEVGRLRLLRETTLQTGDRIRILPNHTCPVVNLTSYLTGVRGDVVERLVQVDIRNNIRRPGILAQ